MTKDTARQLLMKTQKLCFKLSVSSFARVHPGSSKEATEIALEDLLGGSNDDSSLRKLHRCSAKVNIVVGRSVDKRVGCQYCGQETVSEGNKETFQGVGLGWFGCIAGNTMMSSGNKSKNATTMKMTKVSTAKYDNYDMNRQQQEQNTTRTTAATTAE